MVVCAALLPKAAHAIPPHGYRGPRNNGIYPAQGLLKKWPEGGPELLWKCSIPQGYAGVTVIGDTVYIATGLQSELYVLTIDGTLKQKIPIGSASWSRFGGTRSTPLIGEGIAVSTTPNANIYGIDLEKQEIRWQHNAWKSFGAGKGSMGWGLPESPVLNNDAVIFNACSRFDESPPFIALDMQTGRPVWFADAGKGKKYSSGDVSGAAFTHNGRDLYVHPSWRYLACLEARTGKLLWEIRSVGEKCVTPLYNDGYLFSQINSGAVMLKLSPNGNSYKRVWTRRAGVPGWSHAVMLGGRLYMFGNPYVQPQSEDPFSTSLRDEGTVLVFKPSDSMIPGDVKKGGQRAIDKWKRDVRRTTHLLCIDVATGKVLQSRPAAHVGHIIAADGMVYVLERVRQKDGAYLPRVSLIKPTTAGFETTGVLMPEMTPEELVWRSMKAAKDQKRRQWSSEDFSFQINVNPVIARGRLFLRYGPLMVFDLRKDPDAEHPQQQPAVDAVGPPASTPPITDTNLTHITDAQVDRLVEQFGSRFEDERSVAVHLLGRLEPKRRKKLAPRLVRLLEPDGKYAWRRQVCAARTLGSMGEIADGEASDLRNAVCEALKEGDGTLARLAINTLGAVDPGALESAVPKIAKLLRSRDTHVQLITARTLSGIGSNATDAVDALVDALDSEDKNVIREAGAALIAMGPAAADGARDLRKLLVTALEGKRSPLSHLIVDILEKIGGKALAGIGHDAAASIPSLMTLSKGADERLTQEIKRTLAAVKVQDAPPTVRDVAAQCVEGKTVVVELPVSDTDDIVSDLTALVDRPPRHGTTARRGPTTVVYNSTPGFTGEDVFTWKGRDTTNHSRVVKASITVTPDTEPPRLEKATAWGKNSRVTVFFDEPVAPGKAANYSIDSGVKITAVEVAGQGQCVVLTTSPLAEDKTYTLTVKRICDRSKTPNTGSSTATFIHKPYVQGMAYVCYEGAPKGDDLDKFAELKSKKKGVARKFDLSVRDRDTYFALRFDGMINIPTAGEYTFFASSDDGTRIYIGGKMVVQNDGMHGAVEKSGKVTLEAGMHPMILTFYQGMGPCTMKISWSGPGIEKTEIPPDSSMSPLPLDT